MSKSKKGMKRLRKSVPKKVSKAFVKKVQAIIHRNAETKQNSFSLGITNFNAGVNSAADVCRIIPVLTQGTGEANRIGDCVTGQSLKVNGHFLINITPAVVGSGGNPVTIPFGARLMVRAFICSVKKYSNYDDAGANIGTWGPQFLKNGNASQALDGTIESMYLPVNTDVITVHKEIKKYITIPAINTNISNSAGFSNTANDYFNSCKFFSANVRCKKTLKYDDTSFSPQNFAPFFVLSYAFLDGTSPDVLTTRISSTYVSTLKYEDM